MKTVTITKTVSRVRASGQGHCVVFLGKTPRSINGYRQNNAGGGGVPSDGLASHPGGGGVRNILSCLMLLKPFGSMRHLARGCPFNTHIIYILCNC